MERRFASCGVAVLVVFLGACGGDDGAQGPTVPLTPTAPATISLSVTSAETLAPVAGARVVVSGVEYIADVQGRVTVPGSLPPTALVDILAPGFFDRQTTLFRRGPADRLTIWPRQSSSGLTEHFTGEVVYTSSTIGAEPLPGGVALRRWASSVSEVTVSYAGSADQGGYVDFGTRALAVQAAAVNEINDATGGRPKYRAPVPFAAGGSAIGRVQLRIYPEYPPCSGGFSAVATLAEGDITTATITYCDQRVADDLGVSVHELGHTFGLRHSSDADDVMRPGRRNTETFSPRERLVMVLMLQRPAGNRFPDNDRSARAAASRVTELVCPK